MCGILLGAEVAVLGACALGVVVAEGKVFGVMSVRAEE